MGSALCRPPPLRIAHARTYVFVAEVCESAQFVVDSTSRRLRLEVGELLDGQFTPARLRPYTPVYTHHIVWRSGATGKALDYRSIQRSLVRAPDVKTRPNLRDRDRNFGLQIEAETNSLETFHSQFLVNIYQIQNVNVKYEKWRMNAQSCMAYSSHRLGYLPLTFQ